MRTDPLPRALFGGLLLAAALLGAVEAVHLAVADVDLGRGERLMAAVYVMAPYVLFGLLVAVTTAGLWGLWSRARRLAQREDRGNRSADAGAGLVAVVGFVGVLYGVTRVLLVYTHNRALGATVLAIATPVVATGALYFWAAARRQLARLDDRVGVRTSRWVTGALGGAGALAIGWTVARNEALRERLGGWAVVFLVVYPLLTAGLTVALRRVAPSRSVTRRVGVVAGVLAAIGVVDLVAHLDARPGVKHALLHEALVFSGAVVLAQPLFDADGDGYAGWLGGGDCDDGNPDVNPGAREIPRNSVDDDCFGGDSPGTAPVEAAVVVPEVAAGSGRVERPNIVLITVDTLRADHMGFLGYARPTTPVLDAFAERGLRFRWAYAQGPQTKASVPSMFVGRYFSEVDRSPDLWAQLHPENVTLAERLQAAGYHTAGIPAHRFFLPGYGLDQGFVEWDLSIVRRFQRRMPSVVTGHLVSDRAVAWLKARAAQVTGANREPFFLWLHYFDPHHFYQEHDGIDFGGEDVDRYDEEIRYTDEQVGRVLDVLDGAFGDETYVIVHSDHGEGFWEHGYRYHGQHLYDDQVRVPLIVVGPGVEPRLVETPVALLDVVPTVLELAGVAGDAGLRGVSLLGFSAGGVGRGPVFVEMVKDATHSDRRAMIDWPWKLHYGITFDEYALYDLSVDPTEQVDLKGVRVDEFERLKKRLRRWMSEEVEPRRPRR